MAKNYIAVKCWFSCGCQWNVFMKSLPFENRWPMVRFSIKILCGVFGDCQCYVCIEKYLALVSANFVISSGLVHDCSTSRALALEKPQCCTKPWCNGSFDLTLAYSVMLVEITFLSRCQFLYLWVPTCLSHNHFITFRQPWSILMLIWCSIGIFGNQNLCIRIKARNTLTSDSRHMYRF